LLKIRQFYTNVSNRGKMLSFTSLNLSDDPQHIINQKCFCMYRSHLPDKPTKLDTRLIMYISNKTPSDYIHCIDNHVLSLRNPHVNEITDTLVINLKHRKDRLVEFANNFPFAKFQVVVGVNGTELPDNICNQMFQSVPGHSIN